MKRIRFYDSPEVSREINKLAGRVKYFSRDGEVSYECDNGDVAHEGDWVCFNKWGSFVMGDDCFE